MTRNKIYSRIKTSKRRQKGGSDSELQQLLREAMEERDQLLALRSVARNAPADRGTVSSTSSVSSDDDTGSSVSSGDDTGVMSQTSSVMSHPWSVSSGDDTGSSVRSDDDRVASPDASIPSGSEDKEKKPSGNPRMGGGNKYKKRKSKKRKSKKRKSKKCKSKKNKSKKRKE